jgi:signal transduction histidine kinase/ligand-binding sensor domain-containing protein
MSLDLAGLSLTRAQGRQEVGGRSAVDLQIQTVKAYKSRVRAKWLSFALFISLVLLSFFLSQPLFARAQQAGVTTPSDQNEKIPPGSYQLTCVRFDARGNDLRAVCEARNGDWLETELQNARACARDIANDNGKLTCNRNKIAPPAQFLDLFGEGGPEFGQRLGAGAPTQAGNWQLQHDSWRFKDGAPDNVRALAQTSDGFLWVGSSAGLYRFDGSKFELFRSPFGEDLLSTNISSLCALPSGGLWIGYLFGGASFLDKGRVKNYAGEFATNGGSIWSMTQDKDGIVWAAASAGLWRFDHSHWERGGAEWNVPLKSAVEVATDQDGNVWVGGDGIWLYLRRGSRRFQIAEQNPPFSIRVSSYNGRVFDREGSLWFSSPKGIDRFFYSPVVKQEVRREVYDFALAADDAGAVWVGGSYSPLYRFAFGKAEVLPKYDRWGAQFMYRAPDNTLWLGAGGSATNGLWHETLSHQRPTKGSKQEVREALWRFSGRDWDFVELPREAAGQEIYLQTITQDRAGGMWVSYGRHGLYRLADGVWSPYGGRKDLPKTGVVIEFTDSLGRVWFGCTKNTLAVLDGDRVQVFGPNDGLRVGNITAIYGRRAEIWIGGEFGLEEFDRGRFHDIHATNDELLRGISGIVETANGDLWLNGLSGIFHARQPELLKAVNDSSYQVKGVLFGRRGGLPGVAQIRPLPSAIEGTDGSLWFATTGGVARLDPTHSQLRVEPPVITIQSVSADDKPYEPTFPVRFPAHTSSVQIRYSAVSLSEPEAIHFRYKLQETDKDWHETDTAEPASYRNLAPGSYHFSVDATDTNGVWSHKVATAEFTILPAFYQTAWFRLLAVASFFALLWGLYRLQLRQLTHEHNMRLEARVNERTRIARDLHDTLLQSFHGLLLRFQTVSNLLPTRPAEAKETLDSAIDQAAEAITEGRDAVQGLRSSTVVTNDLALAINTLGEELAAGETNPNNAVFHVGVEGTTRDLHPILRDEVYRIAGEAMRNAFKHAQAQRIEVELRYDERQFRLRVRDDGKGIDAKLVNDHERPGHYGMRGMRERAKLLGGKLTVWSELDAGTELELRIPATNAYATPDGGKRSWLAEKLAGKDTETKS